MKKLSSIVIGGIRFKIKYVKDLKEPDSHLHGDTDVQAKLIRINSSDSPAEQAQTLFHEVMHVALHVTGHSENMTEQFEESIVLALDNMLWPILPQLIGNDT